MVRVVRAAARSRPGGLSVTDGALYQLSYGGEMDVCVLGTIRTCDPRLRKPVLYPLSYEDVTT